MDMPIRIAVTGGPCAGKTSVMDAAKLDLEATGRRVCIVPEAATILFGGGFRPIGTNKYDTAARQAQIMHLQRYLEDAMLMDLRYEGRNGVILCDRGLLDNQAYMSDDAWLLACSTASMWPSMMLERYDGVLHLESAAVGAAKHYKNNDIRKETVAEAAALEERTMDVWYDHLNRIIVHNDGDSFECKIKRAVFAIRSLITETER